MIEGHGVGQAGLALGEAMLAVSNHLPVLHVPQHIYYVFIKQVFTTTSTLVTELLKPLDMRVILFFHFVLLLTQKTEEEGTQV